MHRAFNIKPLDMYGVDSCSQVDRIEVRSSPLPQVYPKFGEQCFLSFTRGRVVSEWQSFVAFDGAKISPIVDKKERGKTLGGVSKAILYNRVR